MFFAVLGTPYLLGQHSIFELYPLGPGGWGGVFFKQKPQFSLATIIKLQIMAYGSPHI